ncbi:thioredoxin-disulfide reductase [Thermoclostridium stercorarium subsp. stercorarium DSM 8532]|uniref:Thioredoxin reductase n=3 Tax=Thermoclostridium stercorarium TaxID=1510 RepID=L7VUY8_THES1|nr:thioredoxin-disulfide reductase [Thermoclostridium stercorarium]AGC69398.1 thioredoxin-disulfide reductase [Thermoclostridium stercorarium subsp. stercorarium DSM 8532]AGI40356.1 thioredoxin-disulfide reductase [Thermoclostridium stercorarium subsp. stercorarium DSM 8532]ANW99648.1 thioredoxin reductase [Thermoclostridium stercorarium subsp. thermolacticum DSM 2910]ANX02274.1 thioredoxin reductase [Thermoclostridium stercorarium subsp. leptospartum DSM 9219]UZQ85352.1 thioredoxin-disulfide 
MEITEKEFETAVLSCNLPAAAIFYSDGCPAISSVMPVFENISAMFSDKMRFVKVNKDANPGLARKYNAEHGSTIVFFRDGKNFGKTISGYTDETELKRAIEDVLSNKCEYLERDKTSCDVLILGGGPAGLTAAIYAARARLYTVIVDENTVGGQVATTYQVANYPGTNGVISGIDLVNNMKKQALDFGARIDDLQDILKIDLTGEIKKLKTKKTDYYARAVIIATGATPRKLGIEGEEKFTGKGVHYCATCDGALYYDANVIVVGGGDAAVEEAVFLTRFAKKVTVVHRRDHFTAVKSAQDELFKNPAIEVLFNTEVKAIHGTDFVTGVTLFNNKTNSSYEMPIDGIFIYIGNEPKSQMFKGLLETDERGYIMTDENMQTSVKGVFAAGDVRKKEVRQITTAVGDGTVAAIMAGRYLAANGN